MAHNIQVEELALGCLRAPLNTQHTSDQEAHLNDLRSRYRCYFVECNVNRGAVALPSMFVDDFGDDITRVVELVDMSQNRFECLVEKVNDNIYLTRGWAILRDFYRIHFGAWIMLLYMGGGHFGIILQDRLHQPIQAPVYAPPMKCVIDLENVPNHFVDNLPDSARMLSYFHHGAYFTKTYSKTLTSSDIESGFLIVPYDDFGEYVFDEDMTSIRLVDDCGCVWACDLICVTFPRKHFRIGGQWSKMVIARKLAINETIVIGSPFNGLTQTIYFKFAG